jgi:nucleotide-binding universal stress UspA family protein
VSVANRGGYRTVVVPVDFSPGSESAVREVERLVPAGGRATIHLLHVVEPIGVNTGLPPALWTDVTGQIEEAAKEELQDVAARARKRLDRHIAVQPVLVRDTPHDAICRYAQKVRADLIVIGTHGRTGLQRVVLGSVAERVVRHAGRPVLAVPVGQRARRR